ncbi:MAG: phosphoribosylformylglycinamidine synthase [Candidatus Nomurabacteria bacterium]|jgi:phosphoribosylformylglycinamidine synthase|nr:phosphoribosylformylglycinamidine synthase [Candidatus Nomurabacteria bacterium]
MVRFFKVNDVVYAVESRHVLEQKEVEELFFYFNVGNGELLMSDKLTGPYVGPRRMVETPWSSNAVAAVGNPNITRIEKYARLEGQDYDPMLEEVVETLDQEMFQPQKPGKMFQDVTNIEAFNADNGLALSPEEVAYLYGVAAKYGRPLTDAEIFLFAQVNSEHCRHKIFNGEFRINGKVQEKSLFEMIKETYAKNPNTVVSAYTDNATAFGGKEIDLLSHRDGKVVKKPSTTYITAKAETHNHPTGVSAFPGAATGTGGEIRDRMAVGRGSWPIAGGAAYFVPELRLFEEQPVNMQEREWLYQTPVEMLIRASNGASDFGNKIGQPLINGSVMTFEQEIAGVKYGYDKPIMLASGVGLVKDENLYKVEPAEGMAIVLLGGPNYRIGIGGGSSSSVNLGSHDKVIELNSVQRADPEMQRRVLKVIEHFARFADHNPILSIHDHGAGGHGNCFSELVGAAGGEVWLDTLPIGDPSLTYSEIIGNESQERMGLLIYEKDWPKIAEVAERENCPAYLVGRITGDGRFKFINRETGEVPFDMAIADMFGNPPQTVMEDKKDDFWRISDPWFFSGDFATRVERVLKRPEVASKVYLTSKVDRSVSGLVVVQQTVGPLQAPVADYGLVRRSLFGDSGIAMSQGSAPIPSLINVWSGTSLALTEALTNIVLSGVKSLSDIVISANWMWPCRNKGEDARLYDAVQALTNAVMDFRINIPTGKDSLSMTQKYPDGDKVIAPGTVVVSAYADVPDVKKAVTPQLDSHASGTKLVWIRFSPDNPARFGGSSLALSEGELDNMVPFSFLMGDHRTKRGLEAVIDLVQSGLVVAGHDISDGGPIVSLLEMGFAEGCHAKFNLKNYSSYNHPFNWAFDQKPGLILQVKDSAMDVLEQAHGVFYKVLADEIGWAFSGRITFGGHKISLTQAYRQWSEASLRLEEHQTTAECVEQMRRNLGKQPLKYRFLWYPKQPIRDTQTDLSPVWAAVVTDEGTNGEVEMQYALLQAGFEVKEVAMKDLAKGRETLEDVRVVAFPGGFSNSDVFGSAVGWAGKFKFKPRAKAALENFLARPDTLSLGVCNGCQLMAKLGIIKGKSGGVPKLLPNQSGRFESAFVNVYIPQTNSVWMKGLEGYRLGVWVAHGEGRFELPEGPRNYNVTLRYSYNTYPGNPNGSDGAVAGIASLDGRHLIMMPHPERTLHPSNCPDYPPEHRGDEATPWMWFFYNAYHWCAENTCNN